MSNIPSAGEFLQQTKDSEQQQIVFKLGVVTDLFTNGTAKVQFDGEETASEKQYAYLAGYTPVIEDRVLLAYCSGTYIIMDKILYNIPPGSGTTANGNFTTLDVSGNTTLAGDLKVSGSVAFFGGLPSGKYGVGYLPGMQTQETADSTYNTTEQSMLNHLKSDVNNLWILLSAVIEALKRYNLV